MRILIISLTLLWAFAPAQSKESILPSPTIEQIVESNMPTVSRVRWLGSKSLIADFSSAGRNVDSARQLSLTGANREIKLGQLWSISHDGSKTVHRKNGRWVVRDIANNNAVDIVLPDTYASTSSPPAWSRDGRYLAFADVNTPDIFSMKTTELDRNGVRIIDVGADADAQPRTTAEIMIVSWQSPSTRPKRIRVKGRVSHFAWGIDGRLYYTRVRNQDYPDESPSTVVFSYDVESSQVSEVYRTAGRMLTMFPAISPDGRWMALALDVDSRIWNHFVTLVIVDLSTGKERRLTEDLQIGTSNYVWASDSRALYFTARSGGYNRILRVDLVGHFAVVARDNRRHYDMQISPDGNKLSYQTIDGYGRRDIRVRNLVDGAERVVWQIDDPTERYELGKFKRIQWPNGEGTDLYGYLILPKDFDSSHQYPLLTYGHGGGQGSRLFLKAPFTGAVAPGPLEWHAWAALGYVVFVPDYRSTGTYGPEPVAASYEAGDGFGSKGDVRDIESGVRYMATKRYIDPNRIGVIGYSAGANRVIALLTQTEMFGAAIIYEPVFPGNLSQFIWATTGANTGRPFEDAQFRHFLGMRLEDAPGLYYDSPLLKSYKIDTPALILVGDAVRSRSAALSLPNEMLFTVLRQYGVPTRMLRFVDEGHTFSNPDAALLAFDEARRWLETHMAAVGNSH